MVFPSCCFSATLIFLKGSARSTLRPVAQDSRTPSSNHSSKLPVILASQTWGGGSSDGNEVVNEGRDVYTGRNWENYENKFYMRSGNETCSHNSRSMSAWGGKWTRPHTLWRALWFEGKADPRLNAGCLSLMETRDRCCGLLYHLN